ncbi:NAD(P)-dependent dehydrogenase (short-subunit alcohol dehydrogenase family) [Planktotalea frisia]|jgi:NAD(P)-dependent dehydrogenase (short-subunit alcohol dehydrogenase family)|uniref:C-factor n=1 Tax=Planktotalea frisia TaxID=696762 RepID=A0A1L9NTH9_9RHOB|nr:SDR family NAD(P)-dependent oxidoreductase [Planktotalea frisia]OJI92626.1 C-factor [Planktotalea frisia]PZX33699.1 NAD(P)-dependent dehydrogenase (short-subunit alcohol dehydrogenase family) [Planktotalea frisia]
MQVILTGGNRGIGAQMTSQMRARGDTVLATSRDGSTGAVLDVTNSEQIKSFAASYEPALDLLVCNAGVYLDKGHALENGYEAQIWAETFAVNVTGVFHTIQALLPALRRSDAPKVAIIASQMGSSERAGGNAFLYRASKAAAVNLACNLAIDLKGDGIAVGAYHPGWVQTDMGGAEADIDAATSATGLIARFDKLSRDHTGVFENYDGALMPF